jgi:hypothetical protein
VGSPGGMKGAGLGATPPSTGASEGKESAPLPPGNLRDINARVQRLMQRPSRLSEVRKPCEESSFRPPEV